MDEMPEQVSDRQFNLNSGQSSMAIHVLEPQSFTHKHVEEEITANPTSAKPDWIIRRMQHALVLSPNEKNKANVFFGRP